MGATAKASEKLPDLLLEAIAGERESIERLSEAIARTPRADHRVHLEAHLAQEREHAERLAARVRRIGVRDGAGLTPAALVRGIVTGGMGLVSAGIGVVTAPLSLLRGPASPDEVLRNAEELAAAEAREAARYRALERLAKRAGDDETERLAASIREQEEAQLDLLRREMPRLADHLVGDGEPARPQRRKAATARPRTAPRRRRSAAETAAPSRRARRHSETSGPDRAEAARIREAEREREDAEAREVSRDRDADPEGAGAELSVEEPWPGYDEMSAADVAARVAAGSAAVRAAVRLYEAANRRREVVLRATSDG